MIYEIKRDNVVIFQHEIKGTRTQSAPAVDFVDIEFDYYEAIDLKKNDTIVYKGDTYYCDKQTVNIVKKSNNLYNHRARFVSENYRATEIAILDPQDVSKFEIEGNLLTLLTLAVDNLNRVSSGWSYATPVPNTVTKLFVIEEENVMSFLTKVSGEFEIPFYIKNKVVTFANPIHQDGGVFEYGKGKGFLDLRKSYINNTKVPNTVYATGGDGLVLDNPVVHTLDINVNGVIEGFYNNDDIKPTTRVQMTGVVTADNVVTTTQINYDIQAQKIAGQTPLINFETGALAGYSFYITNSTYDTSTNVTVIYLKKRTVDGALLPSTSVKALAGDYFNITNIRQPQAIIDEAVLKLEQKARRFLENGISKNLVLEANLDPLHEENLQLNNRIKVVDADLGIDGYFVINEIKEDLQNLNKKDISLDYIGRNIFSYRLYPKNDNIIDLGIQNNYDDLVVIEDEMVLVKADTERVREDLEFVKAETDDLNLSVENIETVELPLKENLANKKTTLDFEEVNDAWYPNISAVKMGLADTLSQANTYTTNAVNNAVGGSGVVNSVNGVNVDNSDPKNPIVAEFRPIAGYNSDMLLKANTDGSNATGELLNAINLRHSHPNKSVIDGITAQDVINWNDAVALSHSHANKALLDTYNQTNADIADAVNLRHIHANKAVLDAITASFTTAEKNKLAGIEAGAEVNVNADWNATSGDAEILNKPTSFPPSAHTHPISQIVGLQAELNTKLESSDLNGFIYDVQYNSATHTITFYQQNEPNIVIDLPIEQLIKGVQLVSDDLVFTFEDSSTVTVPLNTLLVGVVKSVNGLTPNSQGEIILNVTDIPNLSSELANKLDIRMAGLVSNLNQTEKDAILTKLGIVNNIVQVLGLSGNTITLSNGGGSISLNIANIGGLQNALDLKADISQMPTNYITTNTSQTGLTGNKTTSGIITSTGGFVGALTGNASTATRLATARTINGTSFDGTANIVTANWGTARNITIGNTTKSVNGSGNVSWSLAEIGAIAQNLSLGTSAGQIDISNGTGVSLYDLSRTNLVDFNDVSGIKTGGFTTFFNTTDSLNYPSVAGQGIMSLRGGTTQGSFALWANNSDTDRKLYLNVGSSTGWKGWQSIATTDDIPTNYITTNTSQTGLSGNKTTSGIITSTGGFVGALTGNASTATRLATARTINGTSFDGTANIVTANWGTARNITIGDTTKSVNGSGNVSWSLAEIGAIAQNLSLGTSAGKIDISNGTGVSLYDLSRTNLVDFNDVSGIKTGGFTTFFNTTGSLNYPSVVGQGIMSLRDGTTQGSFALWANNSDTDRKLYLNVGSSTGWKGWQSIATTDDIPTNYITTNTNQTGLSGNKTTSGVWNFISSAATSINVIRTSAINSSIGYGVSNSVQAYTGLSDSSTFAIGDGGGIGNLNNVSNCWMWVDSTGLVSSKSGFNKYGQNDTQILLAGGGHRPVSDFALASSIPTVNNGQLTLSTGTGLSGSATFTANQAGSSTFSVAVASTHKLPTTAEWNALPTTNTITRLRGTTAGTFTSGDLTLVAGANTSITQSGANITIANTAPNATHTGDVTGATALTIANNVVTHAKYQNIATQRILGRGAAGTGNVQELTLGANLSLSTAGVLSATDTITTVGANNTGFTSGQINFLGSGGIGIGKSGNNITISYSGGSSGIQTIRTDNTAFSGPAFHADLHFNFHEFWGFPQAFAEETQPGNATAKATDDQLDFFASYDSVKTMVEYGGSADVDMEGYHIVNVLLMSNGGDVHLPDGVYAGDQINVTTYPNQQINIYANNLIATTGNEVRTFVNLVWDCDLVGWVITGYGAL